MSEFIQVKPYSSGGVFYGGRFPSSTAKCNYFTITQRDFINNAASPVASPVLRKHGEDLERNLDTLRTPYHKKEALLEALDELDRECSTPNWDCYHALPLHQDAVEQTRMFLRVLPNDLPLPEIAPEPDGSISLDWSMSRVCSLTISVGSSNRLPYAWLDGIQRGHDVECFDGRTIPAPLEFRLRSLVRL